MGIPRRITKKWRRIQPLYRIFGGENDSYDYSEDAAYKQFLYESAGKGYVGLEQVNGKYNGYAVGKHWMDVTVKMWIEDIKNGLLFLWELYEEPEFLNYHWWLDDVVKTPVFRNWVRKFR